MCELIHLTTNGLLSAFSPLSGGNRDGSIDSQRKLLRCSVCAGETPGIFFLMNYQPFVFLHARSPPCPARRAVSRRGGAWPPTLSPSLGPCCVLVVYVDDVVADILSSLRHILPPNCARFSPVRLIVCLAVVFLFSPLRWLQGRDPRH